MALIKHQRLPFAVSVKKATSSPRHETCELMQNHLMPFTAGLGLVDAKGLPQGISSSRRGHAETEMTLQYASVCTHLAQMGPPLPS